MNTINRKLKRQKRVRSKIYGKKMPRLSVHKSNKAFYAQLIDDNANKTLFSVSEKLISEKGTKIEKAKALGLIFAKKVVDAKIKKVVFDRGSFRYHGRVKAFADGAREGGLVF